MPESTAKKQLLEESFTPVKKIVSLEINGWMETYEKSNKKKEVHVPTKFKISKKLPPKCTGNGHKQEDAISPSFQVLKKRKQELMKTTSVKKWGQEKTKPNTAEQPSTGQLNKKRGVQWLVRLPLVHVNQFMAEERQRKEFQEITLIPEFKGLPSKTSRKSSLKKLSKPKPQKLGYWQLGESRALKDSSEMKEIIQQKISKDKYAGFLVSRKNSHLYYEMKVDKMSVRI